MVDTKYNPFGNEEWIETDYGTINIRKGRYFTTRNKKHYFVKYKGFGISTTEIEIMKKHNVNHIVIKYHGAKKNTLYKFEMELLEFMTTYDNQGDTQIIIPIEKMVIIGTEER